MKSEVSVHDEFEVFLCGLDDPLAMLETLGVTDKEHGRLAVDEALKMPSSPTLTPRSTSSSEQEDVTSSDAASKSPFNAHQARLNSKRQYRERRKSELHDLRVESRQLAARRDALVAKRRATEARLVRMSSEHKTIPGWRGVALRQMRQRVEAETLNRQLRTEVRANQALAKHMQSVFTTQLGAVDVRRTLSLVSSSPNKPVAEFSATDMQIISMFTTEMEALYAQAEAVVDSHGLPLRPDSSYNSAVVRRWDPQTKSEHIDFVETFVIPFRLSDAARFLPSALLTLLSQECCPATMRVTDTDDALALKFLFGSDSDDGALIYQASSASKIIHEQHRTVLVWRALIEQQGDEAQYMESGWSVIRVDASGRTVMRMCTRVQPVNSIEGHDVDRYVNKLFTKGEGEALMLNHTIENAVMDQLGAARVACAR